MLDLPPTSFQPLERPGLEHVAAHTTLLRVYSPLPYKARALTFREHGPYNRFDHQRPTAGGPPRLDRGRGILYAGFDLVCCLGEFFADSGTIAIDDTFVATLDVIAELLVVDLRGTAALGVGTTQAISSISQRKTTQAWGRYLYEHPELRHAHGLYYEASNSGRDALALFERANKRLALQRALALGASEIDADLQMAAHELRLPII